MAETKSLTLEQIEEKVLKSKVEIDPESNIGELQQAVPAAVEKKYADWGAEQLEAAVNILREKLEEVAGELGRGREILEEAAQEDEKAFAVGAFHAEFETPNFDAAEKRIASLVPAAWALNKAKAEVEIAYRLRMFASLDEEVAQRAEKVAELEQQQRKLEQELLDARSEWTDVLRERDEHALGKHLLATYQSLLRGPDLSGLFKRTVDSSLMKTAAAPPGYVRDSKGRLIGDTAVLGR